MINDGGWLTSVMCLPLQQDDNDENASKYKWHTQIKQKVLCAIES